VFAPGSASDYLQLIDMIRRGVARKPTMNRFPARLQIQFAGSTPTLPGTVKWNMRNEFTAIVKRDGPWYIAYCAEVPGANGQGKTREECLANLREAIPLILEHVAG
jgi:hypothetical protein